MAQAKPKKRYRACITVDGNKIWVSAHSRKELNEKREQARRDFIEGAAKKQMTFHALADEWLEFFCKPTHRPSSIAVAETKINKLKKIVDHRKLCTAITTKDLQKIINEQMEAGKARNTVLATKSVLKQICDYGVQTGQMRTNMAAPIRIGECKPAKQREPIDPADVDLILRASTGTQMETSIALLYYTGMRTGQMLAVLWSDVDFDEKTISIDKSKSNHSIFSTKTTSGIRKVRMPQPLVDILKRSRGFPTQNICPFPHYEMFRREWNKLLLSVGLAQPGGCKTDPVRSAVPIYTPHEFRHTYITMLYEAGIDPVAAQRLVGHKNYSTTAGIYTHLTEKTRTKLNDKIEDMFAK